MGMMSLVVFLGPCVCPFVCLHLVELLKNQKDTKQVYSIICSTNICVLSIKSYSANILSRNYHLVITPAAYIQCTPD